MKFYTYSQNNSGGGFDFDKVNGIAEWVIIEAYDETHANARAKQIGIYFEGVYKEIDCECCGDRWYPVYHGDEFPEIYGENVSDSEKGNDIAIHYLNGNVTWHKR